MNRLRRVHIAATIVNGLAIAAALIGRPIAGALLLSLSSTLLIWSLETLRVRVALEPRP